MELIKNGKIVLNGKYTQQELEDMLFQALEIIVDKRVDISYFRTCDYVSEYNDRMDEIYVYPTNRYLSEEEFSLLGRVIV